MADVKITAQNDQFHGFRAGIGFVRGVGRTEVDPTDPHAKALLDWFERRGYEVDGPDGGWQIPAAVELDTATDGDALTDDTEPENQAA